MNQVNPTQSALTIDPLPGLVLSQASSLATPMSPETPPTKTAYETALAECPEDCALLSYSIVLESPSGLRIKACSGATGVFLDGFTDNASITSGLSMEQLRRMLVDFVVEPFLRRTNASITSSLKQNDRQQPDSPSDHNPLLGVS